jgi:hypothetical protein
MRSARENPDEPIIHDAWAGTRVVAVAPVSKPICSECSEDLQGEELKGRYYGMCRQCATGEEPEL